MKKFVLVTIAISLILLAGLAAARSLPRIRNVEIEMFRNMIKNYFSTVINGWGIGLNTEKDSYIVTKFNAISVKTLTRAQIVDIIKQAKEENITDWATIKDRIKAAIDTNSTIINKGMIQINREKYLLTNIVISNTTASAVIKILPDYSGCKSQNISNEDCENQSTKVGDMSITKKTAEFEPNKDRVWAGNLNFNDTAYTYLVLVLSRSRI
jgi:hypothetical protein